MTNRSFRSAVLNSGPKMALRAFLLHKYSQELWTFYCMKRPQRPQRPQRYLLETIANNATNDNTANNHLQIITHPNNIWYDFNFKGIFDISHNWAASGRCGRRRGWIRGHGNNKAEWIWIWIISGMDVSHFAFFDLSAEKPLCRGPFSVTSQPL